MSDSFMVAEWSRIEDNGSGDYFIVPLGLFDCDFEFAEEEDPDYAEKMEHCIYIGGYPNCVDIRGEVRR
jgi:hypothetical protein